MAQLSIPQSLIGTLIDIADLGTLDYFHPPNDAPTGPSMTRIAKNSSALAHPPPTPPQKSL